ncbi:MAG: bifunctional riboflavin kinase/FAD synthetase [Anaerolineae bacterium]|nr:bifunctional riboflavin kinase/FAD synthetase [Anaerolineae bacterium]
MYLITESPWTEPSEQTILPPALVDRPSLITIGAFDGIHLGHQHLIGQLIALARCKGWLAGLVTFYPHPASVLNPQNVPLYLTTPGEKMLLLEQLGLDWTAMLLFSPQIAALPPDDFLGYLDRQLGMRGLCVSDDFALGRNRSGDIPALKALGAEIGFEVHVIPALNNAEGKVSSSQIRARLREGDVETAGRLLGRRYRLSGEVVHGAKRGRDLGFPTANVAVTPNRIVPANGIYATWAYLGDERYPSVTNIGTRPSFDNGARSIEAYLLDFTDSIYGYDLVLEFVARLRPEQRFANVQDLIARIEQDVVEARRILIEKQ